MPYRTTPFVTSNFYHIYNRGVEKRQIFLDERDYEHFLQTIYYYQFSGPKPRFSQRGHFKVQNQNFELNPKIVDAICYCFMPNHFHLLLRQSREDGIKEFMGKTMNSYTKYFNTKNNRVGPLFQGMFKAVTIETDEQLLHVSRYIHLNPYVSDLTKNLDSYHYSSYPDYINLAHQQICTKESILDFFKNPLEYKEFIAEHSDYAKELEAMKHLLLDLE
ncbi:MAG: transposase [Candidatus Daviesbacteria bacterium]